MVYFILLVLGNILVETSGLSLNCTNDFEKHMSCVTDAHDCSGLRMTLNADWQSGVCEFKSGDRGCCCSANMILVVGDEYVATVYKDGQSIHSQTIPVYETIKPPAPVIKSVAPLNEIYQVQWKTNAKKSILDELRAIVTYQKKGDSHKSSEDIKPSTMQDMNYFNIGHLEPNTTYVVSVKTYTTFKVFSDDSNKMEFTTGEQRSSSTNGGLLAIILCLSVGSIVISGLAFAFFVKLKGKFWDKAAKDEKPKLLDIKPNKKVILTPEALSVYSLSVEPLVQKDSLVLSKESLSDTSGRSGQTSGISTASSSLDYANTQPVDIEACVLEFLKNAFPIFTPAEDTLSSEKPIQCSPIHPPLEEISSLTVFENEAYFRTKTSPADDLDTQITGDSGYHSSDGPALKNFINQPHVSAVMETDMSYQPCAQSGEASTDSQNPLPVVYSYQDFGKLVEQSNNMSPIENTGECQTSVVIPHVSNDIIVDPGYHCV